MGVFKLNLERYLERLMERLKFNGVYKYILRRVDYLSEFLLNSVAK